MWSSKIAKKIRENFHLISANPPLKFFFAFFHLNTLSKFLKLLPKMCNKLVWPRRKLHPLTCSGGSKISKKWSKFWVQKIFPTSPRCKKCVQKKKNFPKKIFGQKICDVSRCNLPKNFQKNFPKIPEFFFFFQKILHPLTSQIFFDQKFGKKFPEKSSSCL